MVGKAGTTSWTCKTQLQKWVGESKGLSAQATAVKIYRHMYIRHTSDVIVCGENGDFPALIGIDVHTVHHTYTRHNYSDVMLRSESEDIPVQKCFDRNRYSCT